MLIFSRRVSFLINLKKKNYLTFVPETTVKIAVICACYKAFLSEAAIIFPIFYCKKMILKLIILLKKKKIILLIGKVYLILPKYNPPLLFSGKRILSIA